LTIDEAERAIANEVHELLYIFTPDGRQIARFRGTTDHVAVSDEIAQRSGSLGLYGDPVMKDFVIVHNHPIETGSVSFPLSPSDLVFAVAHDLSRLVVISGKLRYELRRPGEAWPLDATDVHETFSEMIDQVAEQEGTTQQTPFALVQMNLRAFQLLHERRWINFEASTIANDD
jgi:hypothetical protein